MKCPYSKQEGKRCPAANDALLCAATDCKTGKLKGGPLCSENCFSAERMKGA